MVTGLPSVSSSWASSAGLSHFRRAATAACGVNITQWLSLEGPGFRVFHSDSAMQERTACKRWLERCNVDAKSFKVGWLSSACITRTDAEEGEESLMIGSLSDMGV